MSFPPAPPPIQSPAGGPTPGALSRPGRLTRDDLLRLGRSASPWQFIPLGSRAVAAVPGDHMLRFLLAAALAKLGLGRCAIEELAALPHEARCEPAVGQLEAAARALPDSRIPTESLISRCTANLDAMAGRAVDARSHLNEWAAGLTTQEWHRASGGNIVRCAAGNAPVWLRLRDDRGEADRSVLPHEAPEHGNRPAPPYIVEGIDPPWFFNRIYRGTPTGPDGYRPRLAIVQADPLEFLDGLAAADLREQLADDRVHFFIGPGAADGLHADLLARLGTRCAGPSVTLATVRTPITPSPAQIIESVAREQHALEARLARDAAANYDALDDAHLAARFDAALGHAAPDSPLRILIPTCRYTTFLRHAADDLAAAFERLGCRARILIEPDDTSQLATIAYLRAVTEFRPDLVVLINYTRTNLGAGLPPGVPTVCWVQDDMPHLWHPATAAAQTTRDFVVGHLPPALFSLAGYSADRAINLPVAASSRKFHGDAVDPALADRLACEIAYVSHHSETPERMHERKMAENRRAAAASQPATPLEVVTRAAATIFSGIDTVLDDPTASSPQHRLRELTARALRLATGLEPDPAVILHLARVYTMPVADRKLRHRVLGWAAALAEERGWRLRIHGRGWEAHPTLARFARPPLDHDEQLRTLYHVAAANLNVSIHTIAHQRVMECSLSGGLPLSFLHYDDLSQIIAAAQLGAARGGAPHHREHTARGEMLGFAIADAPAAALTTRTWQRLGLSNWAFPWATGDQLSRWWVRPDVLDEVAGRDRLGQFETGLAWLLPDPAEVCFTTREQMETLLARAIESPRWRFGASGMIADRVRARLTHDSVVRRTLALVRDSLSGAAAAAPA